MYKVGFSVLAVFAIVNCAANLSAAVLIGGHAVQGNRRTMEDFSYATMNLTGCNDIFVGVYDGHRKADVARFVASQLHHNVAKNPAFKYDNTVEDAIRKGFAVTDEQIIIMHPKWNRFGTTAVIAYIRDNFMWIAHVGDSRAVLARRGHDKPDFVTQDHTPKVEKERRRIEEKFGVIENDRLLNKSMGIDLAMSRALGDFCFRPWLISDPDITYIQLTPEHEFLILASDGLWDVMSNEEAIQFVRSYFREHGIRPVEASEQLVSEALDKDWKNMMESDNITVCIVAWTEAPGVLEYRPEPRTHLGPQDNLPPQPQN